MNPPSFTGSSTTKDPENFIKELNKVFDVMHVADTERVELVAYQLKNVARTWFDQWKGVELRMHHLRVGPVLRKLSWGVYFLGN
uniref:Putative ovule protein n=1 Tax=Solanum chacoense TaxID=4108 RepID=A0A0V0GJT7_SOLCH